MREDSNRVHLRKGRNPKTKRFQKIAAFDVETWGLEPKNFAIGVIAYYEGDRLIFNRFTNPKEMLNKMFSRRFMNYTFYAHNAEYDLLALVDNPLTYFGKDNILYAKSNFILATKRVYEKNHVKVFDSGNLFKTSLENIGKDLGFQKYDTPLKFKQKIPQDIEEKDWIYCERDCEIVLRAVDEFRNWVYENFNSNIGCTIASTALKIWQCNWGVELFVDDIDNLMYRESYFGGRTEVFAKGTFNEPLYYYDINSLYPYVYTRINFPNPMKTKRAYGLENFNRIIAVPEYEGVANVSTYNDLDYPILPMRIDGKLYFPKGFVKGHYNFNELRFAMERGYKILDCDKIQYSEFITSPFAEYGNKLYNLRLKYKREHNDMGDTFSKYLLNSLYGKFGEMRDDMVFGSWDIPHKGKVFQEIKDGWGYWVNPEQKKILTDHTVFAFCSYVTSAARMELYKLMEQSGIVFYCDTDSVLTPTMLETGTELGEIKLEGVILNGVILKPKQYHLKFQDKEIMKFKGIPKRALPESIFQSSISIPKFYRPKEALRQNKTAGKAYVLEKENHWLEGDKRIFSRVDFEKEISFSEPFFVSADGELIV